MRPSHRLACALAPAALVTGSLISVYDFPRINEAFGLEFGWPLSFPPDGRPMTATDAADAALAPLPCKAAWDGESFVGYVPVASPSTPAGSSSATPP